MTLIEVDGYDPGAPKKTVYDDVNHWFKDHFRYVVERRLESYVGWCPEWWRHPEAVDRLSALWTAWEACHKEGGTGPATWWVNFADPIMRVLLDADGGPFSDCVSPDGHLGGNPMAGTRTLPDSRL